MAKKREQPENSTALWLQEVIDRVSEAHALRRMLPVEDFEILTRTHHEAGLTAIEASEKLDAEFTRSRDWMFAQCAWFAMVQGWRLAAALEHQGTMPVGWFTDFMRMADHLALMGKSEHVIRLLEHKEKRRYYPLAMPAEPFRAEFQSNNDAIMARWGADFLKI